jgi:hypothetical protein
VRWLTLKNAARAAILLVVAFILLSLWSEFRPAHSGDSVLEGRAASPAPQAAPREPFDVVREGSPGSYPSAGVIRSDPMTAPPAARPAPPHAEPKPVEPQESPLGKGKRIAITGGAEGVQLHVDTPPAVPPPTPPPLRNDVVTFTTEAPKTD